MEELAFGQFCCSHFHFNFNKIRYGLVVRISGSHPGGPGSIPGGGIINLFSILKSILTQCSHFFRGPTGRGATWGLLTLWQSKSILKCGTHQGLELQQLTPKIISVWLEHTENQIAELKSGQSTTNTRLHSQSMVRAHQTPDCIALQWLEHIKHQITLLTW